jgi:FkbM family methyltransferase
MQADVSKTQRTDDEGSRMLNKMLGPKSWRWRLAGEIRRRLPDVRGRTLLSKMAFGPRDATTTIHFGPNLVFDLNLRDLDEFATWFLQFQPPALGPLLDRVLRRGDGFVDVGANIGIYSCWAARIVGSSGWVHAFEPIPSTFEVLRHHVEQNRLGDTVRVTRAAVGDRPGTMTLYKIAGASGLTSPYPREPSSQAIEVPVVTIDSQVTGGSRPRLIKVDVEGFEQHVLRGMSGLLSSDSPPIVAMELSDRQLRSAGSSVEALLADVKGLGYGTWRITTRGVRMLTAATNRDMNVVLLHPAWHGDEARLLAQTRFPRDWTT